MYLIFVWSEIQSILNVHDFINFEVELYLNSPYILIEEGIIGMLDKINNAFANRPIEEASNV